MHKYKYKMAILKGYTSKGAIVLCSKMIQSSKDLINFQNKRIEILERNKLNYNYIRFETELKYIY